MHINVGQAQLAHNLAGRILPLAIASALLIPGIAQADGGQQVADGVALDVPQGKYVTSNDYEHVLNAYNGGRITTVAGTTVDSTGDLSHGARASGSNSYLDLTGTSITTAGREANGLYVQYGAGVDAKAGADGKRFLVSTTGFMGTGVLVVDSGSKVNLSGVDIVTTGRLAAGFQLADGATGSLSDASVSTSGDDADGIYISNATASISNVDVATKGREADGLRMFQGGVATVSASHFSTSGEFSHGINVNGADISLDLDKVTVRTTGEQSFGLFGPGQSSVSATGLDIETSGASATGAFWRGGELSLNGARVVTHGERSGAVMILGDGKLDASGLQVQTHGAGSIGLGVGASTADVRDSSIITKGENANGIGVSGGSSVSLGNTLVQVEGVESWAASIESGGSLSAKGSQFSSLAHGAFIVRGEAKVELDEGSRASGGNGVLLSVDSVDGTQSLTLRGQSMAEGDVVLSDDVLKAGGRTDGATGVVVALEGGSLWRGATRDAVGMVKLADASTWGITADSRVGALHSDGGVVQFEASSNDTYKTLRVAGDYTGTGGFIRMNSKLETGGALSGQLTDRVLVDGNVSTTGTTYLQVAGLGAGGLTDTNNNGEIDANEGYSLVQVKGESRADAFALAGGYVAAGPWQYTLKAFGPGELDPSQNAFEDGTANWDYRLGNKYSQDEDNDEGERPTIVPQLPAYLSAPTALFNYGNQLTGALHTRMGEIKQASPNYVPHNAEMFVRYVGGQQRYRSDLGFQRYGYDFDQQINALQLGGSVVTWIPNGSTVRVGWSADKGKTDVTPKAVDGRSRTRFSAHGVAAWMTWYQDDGFYLDGVVGGRRYTGKVSTDARGDDTATLRAHTWTASLESGYPFEIDKEWTIEPQAQLTYQSLKFRDLEDKDGLLTKIGPASQLQTRVGVRITRDVKDGYVPYGRFDVLHTAGGRPVVDVRSDTWGVHESFGAGRTGLGYRMGAGITANVAHNVSVYGEASFVNAAAKSGFKGWAASAGARVNF